MDNLKHIIINALEDLKAKDIVCLDVENLTSVTDYMIVATGTSSRHIKSIALKVLETTKKHGFSSLGTEGNHASDDWILIDLGDAIVHVMLAEARDFYQLERLWGINQNSEETNVA